MKTCPNNITVVLKNMSDGHISITGNRKKRGLHSAALWQKKIEKSATCGFQSYDSAAAESSR